MADITQEKIELLRTVLPRGISAGDGGLGNYPEKTIQPASWPSFQSTISESKLYSNPPIVDATPTQQSIQEELMPHPWRVTLEENDGQVQYKIDYNSKIYRDFSGWGIVTVTGLDTLTPVQEGYLVLKGEVSGGSCTSANVSLETELPEKRIVFEEENQSEFNVQIAYIYEEDDEFIVLQMAFSNFTLTHLCVDGKSAIYPIST